MRGAPTAERCVLPLKTEQFFLFPVQKGMDACSGVMSHSLCGSERYWNLKGTYYHSSRLTLSPNRRARGERGRREEIYSGTGHQRNNKKRPEERDRRTGRENSKPKKGGTTTHFETGRPKA